ncbi:MAG: FAD synthetase family protein [Treponema sp.]|nr:FAD synthetase family protein [Treponema sp.]
MKILDWSAWTAGGHDPDSSAAVTIGVFDGVHIGHRVLIDRVLSRAGELEPTVVTFRQNPKELLHPDTFHGAVLTLRQKLENLEESGIGTCVLIDFSGNFSKLSGTEFLSALADGGRTRYLAVGTDFRCGHRLSTDAVSVRRIGLSLNVETEIVDPVLYHGRTVSSSRIRRAVLEGRLPDAFAMLGRPYVLDLRDLVPSVEDRFWRYDGIRQVLPPPGEYRAEASIAEEWRDTGLCVLSGESARIEAAEGSPPRFLRFSIHG